MATSEPLPVSIPPREATPGGPRPARQRLPRWLRRPLPVDRAFAGLRTLLVDLALNTICESAKCPNRWECWSRGSAAFMIAGDRCTRACGFCAVNVAKPLPLDEGEPARIAEAARRMKLRHIVVTAVARDDLPDGGSEHFARTVAAIRDRSPKSLVEVLTPDFRGRAEDLRVVLAAQPDIYNHNLETVRRLTPQVRHRATFDRSLELLNRVKRWAQYPVQTKSGLMLGLGETESEIFQALDDLRAVDCDILTLGQYLQPTPQHLPVQEFLPPATFAAWKRRAEARGFRRVAAGPLVRSSYYADAMADLPG